MVRVSQLARDALGILLAAMCIACGGPRAGADLQADLAKNAIRMNQAKEPERVVTYQPSPAVPYVLVAVTGRETEAEMRSSGLPDRLVAFMAQCLSHGDPALALLTETKRECGHPSTFPTINRLLVAQKPNGTETKIVLRRSGVGVELADFK